MAAEGTQFMTRAITPTFQGNRLLIEHTGLYGESTNVGGAVALFQDSVASAIAVMILAQSGGAPGKTAHALLRHEMAAGTTSATTFKIRAGLASAGTINFNAYNNTAVFLITSASSLRVTEIFI